MPKISLKFARNFILVVLLTVSSFSVGFQIGNKQLYPNVTISREVPVANLNFSLFWQVWDELSTSYYDKSKIIPANMVYGAIKGMVESIGDPYTAFLLPSENKITEDDLSGNFEGVGIQIGFRGMNLAVVSPLPGSPAEKAGIKGGDFIIGIQDKEKGVDIGTVGMSLAQAVQKIRGKAGSSVTLIVRRDGEEQPLTFTMMRQTISVPSVEVTYLGENKDVAQIKILKFGAETTMEWTKVVDEVSSKNIGKIIIDVRNNPGGYLQSAVDIASDFVDSGHVIVIEKKVDGPSENVRSEKTPRLAKTKVVMLINKGSASASEILAGALRDDKKIKLIGETSFGKGTVQEPEQLDGGAGLHITIAKWLTPSGVWVNDKGLEPDMKVVNESASKEDAQLNEAIKQVNL